MTKEKDTATIAEMVKKLDELKNQLPDMTAEQISNHAVLQALTQDNRNLKENKTKAEKVKVKKEKVKKEKVKNADCECSKPHFKKMIDKKIKDEAVNLADERVKVILKAQQILGSNFIYDKKSTNKIMREVIDKTNSDINTTNFNDSELNLAFQFSKPKKISQLVDFDSIKNTTGFKTIQ